MLLQLETLSGPLTLEAGNLADILSDAPESSYFHASNGNVIAIHATLSTPEYVPEPPEPEPSTPPPAPTPEPADSAAWTLPLFVLAAPVAFAF